MLNYGLALLFSGHLDEAERAMTRTVAIAQLPHVPSYDRAEALAAARGNLQVIAVIRSVKQ